MTISLDDVLAGKRPDHGVDDHTGDNGPATNPQVATEASGVDDGQQADDGNAPVVASGPDDNAAQAEASEDGDGADPTPGQQSNPIREMRAALKTTTTERNDWKGRAERSETQAQMLQQQLQALQDMQRQMQQQWQHFAPLSQPQGGQVQAEPDPAEELRQAIRAEASQTAQSQFREYLQLESQRRAFAAHGEDKAMTALNEVQQAIQAMPNGEALRQRIVNSHDPWAEIMDAQRRMQVLNAIGNRDLATFESEMREKIRAELEAERAASAPQQSQQPVVHIPRSMASQRSVASNSATTASYRTPTLDEVLARSRG